MYIMEVMPQVTVVTLLCLKQGWGGLQLSRCKQRTLHSERHLTKFVIIIQLNNVVSQWWWGILPEHCKQL